jgi:hypothetical protein
VGLREGKSEEGRAIRSEKRREDEQSLAAFDRNFDFNYGRAAFGGILIFIWGEGATLGRNFYINIGRAA